MSEMGYRYIPQNKTLAYAHMQRGCAGRLRGNRKRNPVLLAICYPTACYSVAPDGQAFFALHSLPREPVHVTESRLVMSWFEELERLVPTK